MIPKIPIYEISSKSEFQGICNKYKRLRILTDGNVCYVWDAQEFDHFTILNHLRSFGKNVTGLKRFNFENGKVVNTKICDMIPLYYLNSVTDTIHCDEPEKAKQMLKTLLSL